MSEASQYDAIADQYRRSKTSPLRTYIESYTFLHLLGDISGLRVLDLACGEGFYTRKLKALGAARVVGVDQSAGMIRLAEQQEAADPCGVEYVCRDARDLGDLGDFTRYAHGARGKATSRPAEDGEGDLLPGAGVAHIEAW